MASPSGGGQLVEVGYPAALRGLLIWSSPRYCPPWSESGNLKNQIGRGGHRTEKVAVQQRSGDPDQSAFWTVAAGGPKMLTWMDGGSGTRSLSMHSLHKPANTRSQQPAP